jgi:hypothetical protein
MHACMHAQMREKQQQHRLGAYTTTSAILLIVIGGPGNMVLNRDEVGGGPLEASESSLS